MLGWPTLPFLEGLVVGLLILLVVLYIVAYMEVDNVDS